MAWDEWEQLKAEAAQSHSARMQLNQLSADQGSGDSNQGGDLRVSQTDLAAVGDKAFKLWEDLGRFGRDAWSSSQTAAKDLSTQGFELGSALNLVQEKWEEQLTSVLDACAQISNHMDFTKKAHQGDEHYISGKLSSIATLDRGFSSMDHAKGADR